MYDKALLAEQVDLSTRSARVVVPLVMKTVLNVRSVVDVACGTGIWLARFKEAGVARVLGLDGGDVVDLDQLEIDPTELRAVNLEEDMEVGQSFDLCLCLEVAQHVPDHAAATLIRNICKLSDVVLFSAAVPGEGGTRQVNERWPSYWANLFAAVGYETLDVLRGRIWNDARVELRYRQNLLLFANRAGLARVAMAPAHLVSPQLTPLDVIHPEVYTQRSDPMSAQQQQQELQRLLDERTSVLNAVLASRRMDSHEGRRHRFRALARSGWSIVSGKFLKRRVHKTS